MRHFLHDILKMGAKRWKILKDIELQNFYSIEAILFDLQKINILTNVARKFFFSLRIGHLKNNIKKEVAWMRKLGECAGSDENLLWLAFVPSESNSHRIFESYFRGVRIFCTTVYCLCPLGGYVNTRRMLKPDMGSFT